MLDLNTMTSKPWRCTACDVEWKSPTLVPCWLCDSTASALQLWPQPLADTCLIDPVAVAP